MLDQSTVLSGNGCCVVFDILLGIVVIAPVVLVSHVDDLVRGSLFVVVCFVVVLVVRFVVVVVGFFEVGVVDCFVVVLVAIFN